MSSIVEIKGISKTYGKKQVLSDVELCVSSGDCIGILGANGSGKSTLLSILAGVLREDRGSFTYDGESLLGKSALREKIIGYVPQGTPLMKELNALDHLKLWYHYAGRELNADLDHGVPARLGVTEFLKTPVSKMSGGMKKRLSICCSVAHQPKVLLLDEPTAALDLICRKTIRDYIEAFLKEGGIVILVTHDVQEISLCSELRLMKGGRLMPYTYMGDPDRLALDLLEK